MLSRPCDVVWPERSAGLQTGCCAGVHARICSGTMTKSHSLGTICVRGFWRSLVPISAGLFVETNVQVPFHTLLE